MNILYIDSGGVVSDTHQYQYYGDLYRELRQLANVLVYQGPVHNIHDLLSRIQGRVDCIIFGLGYFAQGSPTVYGKITGLDEIKIPVVCMLHKPQSLLSEKLQFCKMNKVDLLLDSQSTYKKHGERAETRSIRSWFTANPEIYYPRDVSKIYDIGFSGALHGNNKIKGPTKNLRTRIQEVLKANKFSTFWNSSNTLDYRINSVDDYATKISECKVWLATTGPTEDVSPRYFEVMLSKTLLLCNNMPDQYDGLFVDGVNCVMYENDLSDFVDKLSHYLINEKERDLIVDNAYDMIINKYTWKHMALNLMSEIERIQK